MNLPSLSTFLFQVSKSKCFMCFWQVPVLHLPHFTDISIYSPECCTCSCLWHVPPVTSRAQQYHTRICVHVQASTFSHSAFTFEAQIISFTLTLLLPVPISPHQDKQSALIVYFLGCIYHIWLTENFTILCCFRNIFYLSNIFPLCP